MDGLMNECSLCMDVWIFWCMYACLDVCVDVWMYGCMDVCMYVCMYVGVCMYVCMHMNSPRQPTLWKMEVVAFRHSLMQRSFLFWCLGNVSSFLERVLRCWGLLLQGFD